MKRTKLILELYPHHFPLSLILEILRVVLFTNPIYSTFSLGLVLVCISLFCILSNFHFAATAQLLMWEL
ncbi:hypothetical protein CUMW_167800 [Citrus unshiu]|uniref:Uncharacterized protein n=1 Tax=Citrus unshiu TaxID=55188 RepID=A0A2H5PU83_CITUN|nr:hypothetical protein CUMW_167800 [Citrus unshiu]